MQQIDLPLDGLSELAANVREKISSLPYGIAVVIDLRETISLLGYMPVGV
jgi:hypothetical protein